MVFRFLKSRLEKVQGALSKTRSVLGAKLQALFGKHIDQETLDELEQIFYEADLGIHTASKLTEKIKEIYRKDPTLNSQGLTEKICDEIVEMLKDQQAEITIPTNTPLVILVVGVNGNGKTTTCAKLAKKFQEEGKKVTLAAADTFRAAAVEQLTLWANQLGCDIVKGAQNSDPAAVAFDALTAAKARGKDVLIIDTAGRLHTRQDLMKELEKIKKSLKKIAPDSPHETLLVLDATTGQNAIDQAKIFNTFTPLTGLILTKLDGTAKGGIVINIHQQLSLPVKFIGLGEKIDDLEPFNPSIFTKSLFT